MYRTNFDFVVEKAKGAGKKIRVAIAGADNENILLGAFQAEAAGFAQLLLVGDEAKITKMLKDLSLYDRNYTIVNEPDYEVVVQKSIDLVKMGMADVLMRGNTQTRDFLMPILDKKNALLTPGRLLTHINILKLPDYPRILAVSDVTIIPEPNMSQRKEIIRNMADLFADFGYDQCNIALLSLVEKPTFHMPGTVEAHTIAKECASKPIGISKVVGPIAYDLIISKEAARLKNYDCPYCGEFDGIVAPNLITGNLLIKALRFHSNASSFGVIYGANIPVAITSRADPKEQSYLSLAAAAAMFFKNQAK